MKWEWHIALPNTVHSTMNSDSRYPKEKQFPVPWIWTSHRNKRLVVVCDTLTVTGHLSGSSSCLFEGNCWMLLCLYYSSAALSQRREEWVVLRDPGIGDADPRNIPPVPSTFREIRTYYPIYFPTSIWFKWKQVLSHAPTRSVIRYLLYW